MPLLHAQERQNFETVYLEDMRANNYTNTKSWLKLNVNTSKNALYLNYDWEAGSNSYSVGQSYQLPRDKKQKLFVIIEITIV